MIRILPFGPAHRTALALAFEFIDTGDVLLSPAERKRFAKAVVVQNGWVDYTR